MRLPELVIDLSALPETARAWVTVEADIFAQLRSRPDLIACFPLNPYRAEIRRAA